MTASETPFERFDELPRLARLDVALLVAAAGALTLRLWPEWRGNPDLSHGFFMPVVFAMLVLESRRGTPRFLPNTGWTRVATVALIALGLAALFIAGLYAAAVDWSHPLVNLALTAALACFLGAGVVLLSSDSLRFVGCNWSMVAAILLWFLCTPIPPGTYSRLTLTLQLWISECVLQSLHVLGIAAIRHGNIIDLAHATVGVEEACSGVRSLISCVFAGIFFSATLVRRPWARIALIVLSAPLALAMNFVRSLTLTLLANAGVEIRGAWHDLTGFAVLAITAAILAGLAFLLGRHHAPAGPPAGGTGAAPRPRTSRPRGQLVLLTSALGVAALLVLFSLANTRPSVRRDTPAPDLNALIPATAPGWQVSTTNDLYQFRDTLQTENLAQRTYRKRLPNGDVLEVILYLAYWHPGQAPVSLVASHTPDACWPGSGWTAKPVATPHRALAVDHRTLADAEYRLFTYGDFPQHVWFWHLYDGRPIEFQDPYSAIALLRIAWNYGFRHDGDQLFVRVSSNHPWSDISREPLIQEFFHGLQPLGL